MRRYGEASGCSFSEAVRLVRNAYGEEALQQEAGGLVGVPPTTFLFDFLRYLSPAHDRVALSERVEEKGALTETEELRGVRKRSGVRRASRRRKSAQQHQDEPAKSVSALSRLLARSAETLWKAAEGTDAATIPLIEWPMSRTGLLRGYGNAIVPAVAAEFIKAFLDAESELT